MIVKRNLFKFSFEIHNFLTINISSFLFFFQVVRPEAKLGMNLSDNLANKEDFRFQPMRSLERRSMTSKL